MTTERHDGNDRLDEVLDTTLGEIRGEQPDPAVQRAAVDRVWRQLSQVIEPEAEAPAGASRIASCADFQSMLPDYLGGDLPKARHLLLEDHLGECVPCRRALKEQRAAALPRVEPFRPTSKGWASTMGWRVAAAAVVFMTLIGFSFRTEVFSFESGGLIRIEAVEGDLFRVTDEGAVPLKVGDVLTLEEGEGVRTAKDSSAILTLADNSQVEMRERSQLAVLERDYWLPGRKSDGLLDLDRGSIIVEASEQGSGHLFVDTEDCNVSVTGTVFAVTAGMKGSRVSVVEGEVHVNYRGSEDVLHPGDQATTRDALDRVPVEQDIAWSRNSEEYLELLREMRALGRELDEVMHSELRYSSDLLDIAPAGTAVYFAMPNISDELGQAYELLQDRVSTSVVLRKWWNEQVLASGGGEEIEKAIERFRTFGDQLGEEIVMTLQVGADGQVVGPLFLARLENPDSFRQTLTEQIAELQAEHGDQIGMRLLDERLSTFAPADNGDELMFWTQGDVLAMTPNQENLWALEAALQGHADTTIERSAFHDRLRDVYREGVEWAVGVDIRRLLQVDVGEHEQLEKMGLLDIQHLIGERKQQDGRTQNRAVLTFEQQRRRMAAWVAEPAPMGALDYISPDANLAAGFVMKDMSVIVDELFEMLGASEVDFREGLDTFEREQGIDIRRDVAGPLGGEIAVALDGPVLPKPSWKVVIEVYDPARLQQTLEWLVEQVNLEAAATGALAITSEKIGGREYHRIESVDLGFGLHYVFDDGYLVAGPSRGLLDRALQNRQAGIRLTDSRTFIDMLPRDGEVNFSGLIYQNMSPILDPLSGALDSVSGIPEDQRQLVQALAGEAKPSLALLYGHPDSIAMASSSEGGLFTSMMDQLSGATGLMVMPQSLTRALEEAQHGR